MAKSLVDGGNRKKVGGGGLGFLKREKPRTGRISAANVDCSGSSINL